MRSPNLAALHAAVPQDSQGKTLPQLGILLATYSATAGGPDRWQAADWDTGSQRMLPNILVFQEHAFVRDLIPSHVRLLAQCTKERRIPTGNYLKRQGDPADEIYLIRSGRLALEISLPHNGALRIETVRAGSVVGWSCFVEPYRWRFDARALSDVAVFSIETKSLRAECDRDHEFGYAILRRCAPVIAERLQATQIKLLELGT